MKSFPIVILGVGVVAGYAAREFVAQSGKKGELAIVTAEITREVTERPFPKLPVAIVGIAKGKSTPPDVSYNCGNHLRRCCGVGEELASFSTLLVALAASYRRPTVGLFCPCWRTTEDFRAPTRTALLPCRCATAWHASDC